MRVVEVTPASEQGYQLFVESCPTALFYHSLGFRDFVLRLLGCEQRYAMVLNGGEVVGAMPLMAASGPYGTVLNSLPYFGSNGGMLGGVEARAVLADWYAAQLNEPGVAAGTVIANPLEAESTLALAGHLEDSRVGMITDLDGPGPPEELVLRSIDGSARRNVQKAIRSGVTVDVDDDGMEVLERLHRDGMAAIGGRSKDPRFFELVAQHFRAGEDYDLYVARVEGQAVAALLVFYFGQTVEYYVPATDVEFRPLQPMAAILHRAMADAATRGFRNWNWGGSWTDHESLIRFKTKWGGKSHVYRYSTQVNAPELLSATPEDLLTSYPGFYVVPFSALTVTPATL